MAAHDSTLPDLLDRIRNRFFGKYRGTVTDVDSQTLRIKAKVPGVLGNQDSGWCMPCLPYAGPGVGFAFLPEVGGGVWIEFEAGDVSYPIWTGCYWRSDEKPAEAQPGVKVIVTKAQHKIILDDEAGTIEIRDNHSNVVTLDSTGITLDRSKTIVISSAKVDINNGAFEAT